MNPGTSRAGHSLLSSGLGVILHSLLSLYAAAAAETDLYLLSGNPTPLSEGRFHSRLYVLDGSKSGIALVKEIVPSGVGTDFIYAYPGERLIMLGSPPVRPVIFRFIDESDPAGVSEINIGDEICDSCSVFGSELLQGQGDNLALSVDVAEQGKSATTLVKPLRRSHDGGLNGLPLAYGAPGTAIPGSFFEVSAGEDGALGIDRDGKRLRLPWHLPANLRPDPKVYIAAVVNSPAMLVLISRDAKARGSGMEVGRYYVYDKARQRWATPDFSGPLQTIRAMGNWIIGYVWEHHASLASTVNEDHTVSAMPSGTNADARFAAQSASAPGLLFAYEIDSGKRIKIDTRVSDSEILLINGDDIYYRIKDTLITAKIRNDSVSSPVTLAKDDELRYVHWAFFGPKREPSDLASQHQ